METTRYMKQQADNGEHGETQAGVHREWITLREMQELLGIGSTKAYELVSSGTIPGVIKIGRIIRINRHQLEGWLNDQTLPNNK